MFFFAHSNSLSLLKFVRNRECQIALFRIISYSVFLVSFDISTQAQRICHSPLHESLLTSLFFTYFPPNGNFCRRNSPSIECFSIYLHLKHIIKSAAFESAPVCVCETFVIMKTPLPFQFGKLLYF